MISVQQVADSTGGTVALSNGDIVDMGSVDAYAKGDLVFLIPEGTLIPEALAKTTLLHRAHAIKDAEDGFYRTIEPAVTAVSRLFPGGAYAPGETPRRHVQFHVGSSDPAFATLLGAKLGRQQGEVSGLDDPFDLDDKSNLELIDISGMDISLSDDELEFASTLDAALDDAGDDEPSDLIQVLAETSAALTEAVKESE